MIDVYTLCDNFPMESMGDRLKWARERARIPSARQAAVRLKVPPSSYAAHENGQNEFAAEEAAKYGKAYGVAPGWLLTGDGEPELSTRPAGPRMVRLVGYVGAGSRAYFDAADLGEVPAPEGSTENTVAVEIRGESLGALFDHWLVFYDDVRNPITPDLIGRLCVVGLEDGRVLVKKVKNSRTRGLFHLISQTEGPIFDVAIEWAARVKNMAPR